MNNRTVLVNGTIITGFAKLPNCGLYIEEDGTIGDIFNMKRLAEKNFPPETV
jgi:N-acetylglucosamine-6-phosphate deacetylase